MPMRNDAAALRAYANKPLKLGEAPAFETAVSEREWLFCAVCWERSTRPVFHNAMEQDRWITKYQPTRATMLLCGRALCTECALATWGGRPDVVLEWADSVRLASVGG